MVSQRNVQVSLTSRSSTDNNMLACSQGKDESNGALDKQEIKKKKIGIREFRINI